jgi:Ca2+-binding RTX toxin-like protein
LNLGGNYSDYTITYDSGTQAYTLTRAGETQVVTEVENFKFKDIDLTSTVLAGLIGPEVSGQTISGTEAADVITFNSNINNSTSNNLYTGSGDDIVYTEGRKNNIFTGSGNDTIYVMAGNDQVISGGSGNDVTKVYSGSTNARLDGSTGNDLFEIFAGADNTRFLEIRLITSFQGELVLTPFDLKESLVTTLQALMVRGREFTVKAVKLLLP